MIESSYCWLRAIYLGWLILYLIIFFEIQYRNHRKKKLKGRFCRTKLYSGRGIALVIAKREAPLTSHKMLSVLYQQKASTQIGFSCWFWLEHLTAGQEMFRCFSRTLWKEPWLFCWIKPIASLLQDCHYYPMPVVLNATHLGFPSLFIFSDLFTHWLQVESNNLQPSRGWDRKQGVHSVTLKMPPPSPPPASILFWQVDLFIWQTRFDKRIQNECLLNIDTQLT